MSHQKHIAYLLEQIKLEHSRVQKDHVLEWIGTDDARLKAFMEVYFNGDPVVGQRAAYVVGWMDKRHQHILAPHYPRMIAEMDQKMHPARKRNVLRLFETVDIPPAIQMDLMDKCFEFIQNPQEPGAIRAFAITVLSRLVEPYPELQAEASLVLQEHLPEAPAAFRAPDEGFFEKVSVGGGLAPPLYYYKRPRCTIYPFEDPVAGGARPPATGNRFHPFPHKASFPLLSSL